MMKYYAHSLEGEPPEKWRLLEEHLCKVAENKKRFPVEFMYQLNREERDEVITICDDLGPLKFARTMPFSFTEHGVAMLSSVFIILHS